MQLGLLDLQQLNSKGKGAWSVSVADLIPLMLQPYLFLTCNERCDQAYDASCERARA